MNRHPVTAGVVFATVALAVVGSVRHVQTQSAPSYGVTDLGTLGGASSVALSIEDGAFPALYGHSATASGDEHAFAGNAWSLRDLGTLGGARSEARASFFGSIVGTSQVAGGAYHAFFAAGLNPMRDLGTLGGAESYATGINSSTVVGGSLLPGNVVTRAFTYDLANSVMTELPASLGGANTVATAVNAAGQIVGYADLPGGGHHAFLYADGMTLDLGSLGGNSEALAISENGTIVGRADVGGVQHAFRYQAGVMQDLGTLGGRSSAAMDVTSAGDIVGWSETASGARRAFIWRNGVMTDLNTLIPSGTGWVLLGATGINDRGAIVGDGEFQGARRAFLLTPPLDISVSLRTHVGSLDTNIPNPHEAGQAVTLGVTVWSNGPFTATGITVTDTLSGPVEILGWSGADSCVQDGLQLTCRLRPVDFGRDLLIRVRSTAAGVFTHSATVRADQPDPDPSNNTSSESNRAVSLATLTVSPTSLVGGGVALGRATLTSFTPQGGARVTLTSSHPEIASVPSPFDVLPWCCDGIWREFNIFTQPVSEAVTVQISATYGLVTQIVPLTITPASMPGRAPYRGAAREVPGTIQAEDFDEGGQGVAYHDADGGNSGGAYRTTGVDIEATSDSGGGHNVGWIAAGEWLEYTVHVAETGTYTLEARLASPGPGGTLHISFDGADKTGSLSVPDTGGWQAWTTVTRPVMLEAGTRVMRVSFDSVGVSGAFGNLNYIRLSPASSGGQTPFGGTARPVPGLIQAEDFNEGGQGVAYGDADAGNNGGQYRTTAVDVETTSDAGGGYNVGWIDAGEWLEYTVNVATSGTYLLEARVASPGPGGTFHIEVDGVDKTGSLSVPDTGGWQAWTTVSRTIPLDAGTRVLRVAFDTTGVTGAFGNLNWLRIASASTGSLPFGGTPASIPGRIEAEDFDEGGPGLAYADTSLGNSGEQYRGTDVDIEGTTDIDGGYNVGWMTAGEWLAYTVDVESGGQFTLQARVAAQGPGGTFRIEANGVDLTGPVVIPDTGGWQNWTSVAVPAVHLSPGRQVLRVVMDANGPTGVFGNINYLQFSH